MTKINTVHSEKIERTLFAIREHFVGSGLGRLEIAQEPICFCELNGCVLLDQSPMIVPSPSLSSVGIHLSTSVSPDYYPAQLLYQYSHELWHAYEFQRYGIDFNWKKYEKLNEPYAYAASLCLLSKNIIPADIYSDEQQTDYYIQARENIPLRVEYQPGVNLARLVGYDLSNLFRKYLAEVDPLVRS
jgi:hypothetical protein